MKIYIITMRFKIIFILLFCNVPFTFSSNVDTVLVESKSMKKTIPNIVILPDTYMNNEKGFSVLYLLHGAGGNFKNWLQEVPEIKEFADTYNIIIVCPDGGNTSWYFDSPIDIEIKYETYISKELIETIDFKYNTIAKHTNRAITGLSMGGHGAFYLAFKHPDIWGAAGSMSGGVDIRPFQNKWDLTKRLGEYCKYKENWEDNTVINMVYLLDGKNLKLIFDCGIDDFFYDVNKRFHEHLIERNIKHDYIERPGFHNWDYWRNSIKYHVLYFSNYFKL